MTPFDNFWYSVISKQHSLNLILAILGPSQRVNAASEYCSFNKLVYLLLHVVGVVRLTAYMAKLVTKAAKALESRGGEAREGI